MASIESRIFTVEGESFAFGFWAFHMDRKILLWLRDYCAKKAAWHKKQGAKWAGSLDPCHVSVVQEEKEWEVKWTTCCLELERILTS